MGREPVITTDQARSRLHRVNETHTFTKGTKFTYQNIYRHPILVNLRTDLIRQHLFSRADHSFDYIMRLRRCC